MAKRTSSDASTMTYAQPIQDWNNGQSRVASEELVTAVAAAWPTSRGANSSSAGASGSPSTSTAALEDASCISSSSAMSSGVSSRDTHSRSSTTSVAAVLSLLSSRNSSIGAGQSGTE